MPKTKNSPVHSCELCDFKATNGYIFKRHLHRCLSIHGIASKRSSPRNPIRLKGTEGLLSKDPILEESSNGQSSYNAIVYEDSQELEKDELLQGEGEIEDGRQQSTGGLQRGVTGSDQQSEVGAGDPDASLEAGDSTHTDSSIQGAPYCRQYNCSECSFECRSAREHLLHQRNVHGHKFKIYACKICDYASRYGNKVERHMSVHNILSINTDEQVRKMQVIELTSPTTESQMELGSSEMGLLEDEDFAEEGLKVQPLKLKRLNIKMPFKVSGSSKRKSGMVFPSSKRFSNRVVPVTQIPDHNSAVSPDSYTEVYRMVMSDDGSHHYQCRDCLYYAAIPSSVKKHHALCHNRLLSCPHCSLTTAGQGILYEHLITHEGYGYIKCPDCSYVTNAKSNFEKHRSFHNGDYPVRCTVCNFGADSESKIKRHVATQHTPAPVEEEQCVVEEGADVNQGNYLDSEQSDQVYDYSNTYDDVPEGEMNAQADETGTDIPEGSVEYRCPKCSMVCYRRGNFTRHLTAKHKFNQSSAAALSKSMESQMHRRLKRKRSAPSFVGLKQPMENLKCMHCSYIAKWPSDFRRHMQVHTIVKRFKCSICPNKYKYLGDLNVHMRRDHNMEPPDTVAREVTTSDALTKASPAVFRCPICPFTSHSKAELEQHSRNHGNTEKTYQCRLCEYQTYWRGDVSRHLFRHHKIILSKEATEIGSYFIHRPDIKPLAKQGGITPAQNRILSMSPLLDPANLNTLTLQGFSDYAKTKPSAEDHNSLSNDLKKETIGPGPVFLKEGAFVCEYPNCDFKTTISDRMETHLAVHLNLKLFMCPTCGKRTNWKWDVVKHMSKVHMNPSAAIEDVITLSIDEAKATIQDYLNNYEKKSKDLIVSYCSLCSFRSLEKNRVVRHLGTVHRNENGKVISQTMFNSQKFSSLSYLFNEQSAEELGLSLDDMTEVLPPLKFIEPPPEELAKYEKPYACAICRKPGSTKGDIKKHYNYTHPYKDVRILYIGDGTEFNYYSGEIYQKLKSDQFADQSDFKTGLPPISPTGKTPRPDSKFSNPKMHGYVKPFKCSICGLRSNWKWDLKKHLRSKHPNEGGFVILLSIEEASETYGKDCTPSHPKNEDFLSIPTSSTSPSPSLTPPNPSPVSMVDPIFKPPPNIKAEILNDSNGDDSLDDLSFFSSLLPQSPSPTLLPPPPPPPPLPHRGKERSTFLDPTRRQWKCSGCNYITNWRRNMARHINRKHPEGTVRILALHKGGAETSNDELMGYLSQSETSIDAVESSYYTELDKDESDSMSSTDMKLWSCSKCTFTSRLRTHIILHMQQHEMKPFVCGVCNMPFMNRGPLHRHLQKVHKRSDYLKLCKVNINYDEETEEAEVDTSRDVYIISFFCRLCNLESANREEIAQHLIEVHGSYDSDNDILKIQKHIGGSAKRRAAIERYSKNDPHKFNKKFHYCTICPYRSQKKAMLSFHMSYHKPNPANRYKCKHCPYYVSALRLLHQHQRKWHKDPSSKLQWEKEEQTTSVVTPPKVNLGSTSPMGTPRRHSCEKCPYTTNSKNDFIYHKQFHRPKRTAEFKCEYCDYWVVHKRLLKQHMRLHTGESSPGAAVDVSPIKSLYSDPGLVYDPVELAELAAIKQKMISAKITSSLSNSPTISPMKLASQCSVDDRPGYIIKNGLYRKLHKCRFCPYTNIRSRNMQLHELMHGPRESNHPLMKCPYCDYYVGSKGLLSHHMKVHQKNYGDTPENDAEFAEMGEMLENEEDSDQDILPQQKVDTLLQISRFKRFGCERCPYASAKRQHFVRHLELHGSRQRYTCQYCDYSVPSNNLLLQHIKLHLMPNQNLLASQSITNLQHLTDVPADVALASALPPADSDTAVTISVIHDHLELYENSIYDPEPKKLYRCDRCPYANMRRDYLLSHLKFHMVPSALLCPYCDYSAPKQPLLTQHIRVHFCPLPELSDWLLENGQTERESSLRNPDLAEALKVAHEYQNQSRKKDKGKATIYNGEKVLGKDDKPEDKENVQGKSNGDTALTYICQYCDREFPASDKLVKHELQHLIGNHFERTEYIASKNKIDEQATLQMVNTDLFLQQSEQDQESHKEQFNENYQLGVKENGESSMEIPEPLTQDHIEDTSERLSSILAVSSIITEKQLVGISDNLGHIHAEGISSLDEKAANENEVDEEETSRCLSFESENLVQSNNNNEVMNASDVQPQRIGSADTDSVKACKNLPNYTNGTEVGEKEKKIERKCIETSGEVEEREKVKASDSLMMVNQMKTMPLESSKEERERKDAYISSDITVTDDKKIEDALLEMENSTHSQKYEGIEDCVSPKPNIEQNMEIDSGISTVNMVRDSQASDIMSTCEKHETVDKTEKMETATSSFVCSEQVLKSVTVAGNSNGTNDSAVDDSNEWDTSDDIQLL